MKKLYIDSSSEYLSMLLVEGSETLFSVKVFSGRRTAELILPQLDCIVKTTNISVKEIDKYYCIIGPGSFTGVRIGIAFTYGLSLAYNKEIVGINSLDAMAVKHNDNELRSDMTVISRLKDQSFALKRYNFKENIFSDIELVLLDDNDLARGDFITVNSSLKDSINLEKLAEYRDLDRFSSICEPLYLRKSEAEISFDKARDIR